jgi:pimeloyl-ACP methyl ester carboxylesterase
MNTAIRYLKRPDGERIAYHALEGKSPGVLFCGGFNSDMTGTKATALAAFAAGQGRAFVRFDYFGHGASSGEFRAGTIGRWIEDALAVLDAVALGPQILIGSSMGAWVTLHLALRRPARVRALIGIAPAPDFTEELLWRRLDAGTRLELREKGVWFEPSPYSPEPTPITLALIEEGRRHLLLGKPIEILCPVHLVHGLNDRDVPWQHALKLMLALQSRDVALTLVKEGDHRLSEPSDLKRLVAVLDAMLAKIVGRDKAAMEESPSR